MAIAPANWSSLQIDSFEVELDKVYVLPTPPNYNNSPDLWKVYYRAVISDIVTTVELDASSGDQVFVTEVQHPVVGRQYAIHIRTVSGNTVTAESVRYVVAPGPSDSITLQFRLKNLYGQLGGAVPVLQALSVTSSSFSVTWTYSQHNANKLYYVEYSADQSVWSTATPNGTQTNPYGISDLTSGTTYYVRVRAFDTSLQTYSGYSNMVSDTTSAGGGK